jgi:hypothetical protein
MTARHGWTYIKEIVAVDPLTAEERQFIIQALNQLNLTGKPADLGQALTLIESISQKLLPPEEGAAPSGAERKRADSYP